jgi:hypothetical protein
MLAIAASEVQDDVSGPGLGYTSDQCEPVFQQALWVTVLFRRSGGGTLIEERPEVRGVG